MLKKPKTEEVTYVQLICSCKGKFTILGVTPAETVLQCQGCGEIVAVGYGELANFAAENITVKPVKPRKGNGKVKKGPMNEVF